MSKEHWGECVKHLIPIKGIYLTKYKMENKLLKSQTINLSTILKVSPWFVTGFADGEGSFMLWVWKSNRVKTGWQVSGVFSIHLHSKDLPLLQAIQAFFEGVWVINKGFETSYK